jgi:hypothetical protein
MPIDMTTGGMLKILYQWVLKHIVVMELEKCNKVNYIIRKGIKIYESSK